MKKKTGRKSSYRMQVLESLTRFERNNFKLRYPSGFIMIGRSIDENYLDQPVFRLYFQTYLLGG